MSFPVSNVAVSSDTFSVWVERTNTLCDLMTREVVTANSLSTGAVTTGNAFVNGIFSAQTFAVNASLRGGNVNTSANLAIISNANFTGASVNIASNVAIYDSNVYVNTASLSIVGGLASVTSNVLINNTNTSINAVAVYVSGGTLNLTSNVSATQANITLNTTSITHVGSILSTSANITVTGTLHTIGGNVAFDTSTFFVDATNNRVGVGNTAPDAVLAVTGTANVSGASRFANTLTIVGAVTGSNTLAVTGNATFSNTLAVTGNATFSNTLAVTGNATFSNSVSIANTVTINTDHVIEVYSNTDLGSNTTSPQLVYSFNPLSYSTVKILAQVRNASGANSQGNEMILTHNGTDSSVTVYGTVSVPSGANLGIFSTSINSTAVSLNFTQSAVNSKIKIVAHLLK